MTESLRERDPLSVGPPGTGGAAAPVEGPADPNAELSYQYGLEIEARSQWAYARIRFLRHRLAVVSLVVLLLAVLVAIFAKRVAPYGYDELDLFNITSPPTTKDKHLFGTDLLGRDYLSRVIFGLRTSLWGAFFVAFLSTAIGTTIGALAGYYGGWFDRIMVLIMDAFYAFPSFLLAIVFSFLLTNAFGGSVIAVSLSLSAIYIPQYFRVVRNTTLSAKEATYVEAARAIGASDGTIMRRYLFGNVIQSVPVLGTLNAADAILTLAGLGFLGLGIQSTEAAEWGHDLNRALADAGSGVWWTGLYPGMAIVLLVTGLTLVGEGLNETLNPTLRRRRLLPVVMPPRNATVSNHEEQS